MRGQVHGRAIRVCIRSAFPIRCSAALAPRVLCVLPGHEDSARIPNSRCCVPAHRTARGSRSLLSGPLFVSELAETSPAAGNVPFAAPLAVGEEKQLRTAGLECGHTDNRIRTLATPKFIGAGVKDETP